ncbi:MAG: hypothetical protein LBM68_03235 [Bacteroidales bacterium]|jgi:hypothetical protein|nr:hypothetical protein [Bacteroidales bacterium]
MTTLTIQYDARNSQLNALIDEIIQAGAKILEPPTETISEKDKVLKAYQKMFGKRRGNKYTEEEIFIFNSKLQAAQTIAKYV